MTISPPTAMVAVVTSAGSPDGSAVGCALGSEPVVAAAEVVGAGVSAGSSPPPATEAIITTMTTSAIITARAISTSLSLLFIQHTSLGLGCNKLLYHRIPELQILLLRGRMGAWKH